MSRRFVDGRTGGVRPDCFMTPGPLRWIAAGLLLLGNLPMAAAEPGDSSLTIRMGACRQADCALSLTFSRPMINAERAIETRGVGPVSLSIDPPVEGRFRWTSAQELLFHPRPGALAWGNQIRVRVDRAVPQGAPGNALAQPWSQSVRVPYFRGAGKVASWPVAIGRPRFVAYLNDYTRKMGAGPLYLLFDQPVAPAEMARLVRARDRQGRALKVRASRPKNITRVWADPVDLRHVVALRVRPLPPHGSDIFLSLPTWRDGRPTTLDSQLQVQRDFSLVGATPGGDATVERIPVRATWTFEFTSPVGLKRFREALTIRPAPRARHEVSWGTRVRVTATLDHGTRYKIALADDLIDILGNRLGKPFSQRFRTQDKPPLLVAPTREPLLERGTARLPIKRMNVDDLRMVARPFASATDFIRALETPGEPTCQGAQGVGRSVSIRGTVTKAAPLNKERSDALPLRVGDGSGLLCVSLHANGRGTEGEGRALQIRTLAQVSRLAATVKVHSEGLLAWVTRLDDGRPVEGAVVRLRDASGTERATAWTDAHGVAHLLVSGLLREGRLKERLYVIAETRRHDAARGAPAGSSRPPETVITRVDDKRLSNPWQFGLTGEVPGRAPLHAAVFTERGVYRPGETVHIKIIAPPQAPPQASSGIRPATAVTVRVQDARGQKVVERTRPLDAFGGADLDIALKDTAPVGAYSVRVTQGSARTVRRFRVEEFRVPTFAVKLGSPEKHWTTGARVHAQVKAAYYHGGQLAGRDVRYTIDRSWAPLSPKGLAGYRFAPPGGRPKGLEGTVGRGQAQLDTQGSLDVELGLDVPAAAGPMRYVVDATVSDVDRQAYGGRLTRTVHPTSIYLGLRPPGRAVLRAGRTLEVPVVALDPNGRPQAGVKIRTLLERIDHHTAKRLEGRRARHLNREIATVADTCRKRSRRKPVTCRFVVPKPGRYRVTAYATDAKRRKVTAGFEFRSTGETWAAWPRFDQDRIEIVADRAHYAPGDTARIIIESPFRRAQGLLTLEQGGVLSHRTIEIKGDTPEITVPITDAHGPNLFVSVVLLRGRAHHKRDAAGFETGAPAFKMGYVELKVEPVPRRLDVDVAPDRTIAWPGTPLHLELSASGRGGPANQAQATVMIVDEAVLALTGYRTPNPLAEIFGPRPLGVRTGEARLELPHARRMREEPVFPGGDGGSGFSNRQAPEQLRNLFKSTAYWNPNVPIGADGRAQIDVDLPDNVTTYRVMAVVVDTYGRVGSAARSVTVQKPLMVQPVMPRFLYPGDTLTIEALVFNATGTAGEVSVGARFSGLERRGMASDLATTPTQILPPGGSGTFPFQVRAGRPGSAMVELSATLGTHQDRVQVEVPVLEPGTRHQHVEGHAVTGSKQIAIPLPGDRQPGSTQLELLVSTTALSRLKDSVGYLMAYPNGCIEQTTSRAYPLVMLDDLLPEMGVEVDREKLHEYATAGIKRILSFQTPAGGLSYWPGGQKPHAFATAFGLTALIEGKKRGYDVTDDALARMADYLERSLREGKITGTMPHGGMADADTRALFVMTLGRLGRPQPAYIQTLWSRRVEMTPFGISFLAVAIEESKGDRSLLEPALAAIREATEQTDTEAWYAGKRQGGWSLGSPLRTHAVALLAHASMPSPEGTPDAPMEDKLLRGLLNRQRNGLWGNTQENVFGIMGVAKAASRGQGLGQPRFTLRIGRLDPEAPTGSTPTTWQEIPIERMETVSGRVRRVRLDADDLKLREGHDETVLVDLTARHGQTVDLSVRSEYEAKLDAHSLPAQSNGMAVRRTYETLRGEPIEDAPIALGTVVRVRLEVDNQADANYVAIADKLPAGLEPMNMALETTERVSQGALTPALGRGLSVLSHHEMRDARVAFYADALPKGAYAFSYLARATTAGHFVRPQARAEAMYDPDVSGTTSLDSVMIAPNEGQP